MKVIFNCTKAWANICNNSICFLCTAINLILSCAMAELQMELLTTDFEVKWQDFWRNWELRIFLFLSKVAFLKAIKPCEMELLLKSRRLQNHHDKKLPSKKFEILKMEWFSSKTTPVIITNELYWNSAVKRRQERSNTKQMYSTAAFTWRNNPIFQIIQIFYNKR